MGPMLFSPLSEIPAIGRNPPYVVSFTVFVVVSVILAVLDSFPAILVLRFLQGFFGSPCLASGGASIQDIFSWSTAPYGFVFWVGGFYCGPALGPLLAGYAVSTNWRWPLWETVIIAAPFLIVLVVLLPETSHETLLLRRAQRLRRRTGNPALRAVSETKTLDFRAILVDALVKPTEIAIKDPAIAFVCVYSSFVYAIYYSFFEAFPITYGETYTMSLPSVCLVFLCIIVGCVGAGVLYCGYLYYIFLPRSTRQLPSQESRLIPALPAVCFLPAGLFLYAWTARSSIHWLVPTLGVTVYAGASFVVFQAIICYVPLSYPQYVASLFAANDFMRSMAAAGFVMFSRAMYVNLGVAKGVTVLGGLSIMGILGMFFLYVYGGRLRERSRFAAA